LALLFVLALPAAAATTTVSAPQSVQHHASSPHPSLVKTDRAARLRAQFAQLPLRFEVNNGQSSGTVRFWARGSGYTLFLTATDAVLSLATARVLPRGNRHLMPRITTDTVGRGVVARLGLPNPMLPRALQQPQQVIQSVLRLHMAGANPHPQVVGLDRLPGVSNYFIGRDPRHWRTNVPAYARVAYRNIYPGVDLVYYGNQGHLEYDFVVAPGASARAIRLALSGAGQVHLDRQGDVLLHLPHGDLRQVKPLVYQEEGSTRRSVSGRYVQRQGGVIGLQVGAYDQHRPLIIDPVLTYSTYLGGSGSDLGVGIAVDGAGNAYVTGGTVFSDFPTTTGAFSTTRTGYDEAFVSKLDAAGSALVYSTYLGGSNYSSGGAGIAVDGAGNAYVTGETDSSDFPTTTGAFSTTRAGYDTNAFVSKFDATGGALVYSTYLGGHHQNNGTGIAVDEAGDAYVTGTTDSSDFPTTTGAFSTNYPGDVNAFVSKIDAAGGALVYSTYLGGSGSDLGAGIAVDGAGDAYVTGKTDSSDFPTTTGAFSTTYAGGNGDAFVSKFDAAGSALVYSTYLGSSGFPSTAANAGIAVDRAGDAYVTGSTVSSDFPTTPGALPPPPSGSVRYYDAFVSKIDAAGGTLVYSTYLGGSYDDIGRGIAIDGAGDAYVTGYTNSSDFPTTTGAFSTTFGGYDDAFVAKLSIPSDAPTPTATPIPTVTPAPTGTPTDTPTPANTPTGPQPPVGSSCQGETDNTFQGANSTSGRSATASINVNITRFYGAIATDPDKIGGSDTPNGRLLDTSKVASCQGSIGNVALSLEVYGGKSSPRAQVTVNGYTLPSSSVSWNRDANNSGWWYAENVLVPAGYLVFPDLNLTSSDVIQPPFDAENTISVNGVPGGTSIAWVRLGIVGVRPLLLVHGINFMDAATNLIGQPPDPKGTSGWSTFGPWLATTCGGATQSFLEGLGVPNVRCQQEDAAAPAITQTSQDPSNPAFYPSDARVFVSGFGRAQDNAAIVTDWLNMVRTRYGVARVNLVGYSKGGVDTSYATPYIHGQVANEFLLNSPYAGTPLANFLMDDASGILTLFNEEIGLTAEAITKLLLPRVFPAIVDLRLDGLSGSVLTRADSSARYWGLAGTDPNIFPGWLPIDEIAFTNGCSSNPCTVQNDGAVPVYSVQAIEQIPGSQYLGQVTYTHLSTPPHAVTDPTISSDLTNIFGLNGDFAAANPGQQQVHANATRGARVTDALSLQPGATVSGSLAANATRTVSLPLGPNNAAAIILTSDSSPVAMSLQSPDGAIITPDSSMAVYTSTALLSGGTLIMYHLPSAPAGAWTATITNTGTVTTSFNLGIALASAVTMSILPSAPVQPNTPATVTVALIDGTTPATGATITATAVISGIAPITTTLQDRGDGTYSGSFGPLSVPGNYTVFLSARGDQAEPLGLETIGTLDVASGDAALGGRYTASTASDSLGLISALTITPTVQVHVPGDYSVSGELTDRSGNIITVAGAHATLAAGVSQPLALTFSGSEIAAAGKDGPFQLRDLTLIENQRGAVLIDDSVALAYTTQAYSTAQFTRPIMAVLPGGADAAETPDSFGRFETLAVTLTAAAAITDTYLIQALLTGSDGSTVATVPQTATLGVTGAPLHLDFPGTSISASGVDGPYKVEIVSARPRSQPSVWTDIPSVWTTQAYTATEFSSSQELETTPTPTTPSNTPTSVSSATATTTPSATATAATTPGTTATSTIMPTTMPSRTPTSVSSATATPSSTATGAPAFSPVPTAATGTTTTSPSTSTPTNSPLPTTTSTALPATSTATPTTTTEPTPTSTNTSTSTPTATVTPVPSTSTPTQSNPAINTPTGTVPRTSTTIPSSTASSPLPPTPTVTTSAPSATAMSKSGGTATPTTGVPVTPTRPTPTPMGSGHPKHPVPVLPVAVQVQPRRIIVGKPVRITVRTTTGAHVIVRVAIPTTTVNVVKVRGHKRNVVHHRLHVLLTLRGVAMHGIFAKRLVLSYNVRRTTSAVVLVQVGLGRRTGSAQESVTLLPRGRSHPGARR